MSSAIDSRSVFMRRSESQISHVQTGRNADHHKSVSSARDPRSASQRNRRRKIIRPASAITLPPTAYMA